MKLMLIMLTVMLTGCGTYGEPLLLSRWYDSRDPCQLQNNHGQYPSWCGAGSARQYIYATPTNNPLGAPVGYIKK